MPSPTATCEIAFASNPSATPVWTDVSDYLIDFRITRGRQMELNRMEAGTAQVTLDNRDRRFDPSNAASPYAPNVVPVRRIRLSATYNAVTYRLFSGYIESWPPLYPGPLDSNVTVTATDGFKVLNLKTLPGGYPAVVQSHTPIGYWRLNETSGTTAADSSGNGRSGTYTGGYTLAQTTALVGDEGTAVTLNGTSGYVNIPSSTAFDVSTTFTLEAWIKPTAVAIAQGVVNRQGWYCLRIGSPSAGAYSVRDRNAQGPDFVGPPLTAGVWYHVVFAKPDNTLANSRLYVNGVAYAPSAVTGGWAPLTGAFALQIGVVDAGEFYGGVVDEVAIYNYALTAQQVADHYAAGAGVFYAQNTGARINSVLNVAGWPAADRSLGVGDTTIQAGTLTNSSALDHIQNCMDAENGLFFMTGAGVAKFVNRGARLMPPYTVSQGTFGDGGELELLYVDIALDYSDLQLWNDIRYTRFGGTVQLASDTASQTRYYARTLVKDGLLANTDNETLQAAQWARDRFRNPALRVQRVIFDGEADPDDLYPHLFGRELGDRVTVRKTPPGGGARIEQVGHIEQIDHEFIALGGLWVTAWQMSPADLQLYWILEHATQGILGSTTVLSY